MPVNSIIQLRKGTFSEWETTNPILASGEPGFDLSNSLLKVGDGVNEWNSLSPLSSDIHLYVKNTAGYSLNKGQVVYINGAQGDNPTISLAIASGESTSSKTLGLLKQDLDNNEFGYVIVEGLLEGINTDAAGSAGDAMWLSPTVSGAIVYGLSNKPSAPNHMVFLGYVLRKQNNNGKVYVKAQNGFELQELHNVAISGVTDGQFLQYNSSSGLWVASSSGNFTSLQVNGTGVSISGHTHISSNITDFNSSVSGLLPITDIVGGSNISVIPSGTLYTINVSGSLGLTTEEVDDRVASLLVAGSGINLNYDDNGNTLTISSSGTTISNASDNRILTSDGTSNGINGESNLTFDGSVFNVDGNIVFDSFTESVVSIGSSGPTQTLSIGSGTVQTCTLTSNCVFTMPSAVAGKSFSMFLNSGSGNYTASFSGVLWSDSAPITVTTIANKMDILSFISDGTYWYGSYSQNYG
jgi:hypothetical protein